LSVSEAVASAKTLTGFPRDRAIAIPLTVTAITKILALRIRDAHCSSSPA
jgi:hypothetical protein